MNHFTNKSKDCSSCLLTKGLLKNCTSGSAIGSLTYRQKTGAETTYMNLQVVVAEESFVTAITDDGYKRFTTSQIVKIKL